MFLDIFRKKPPEAESPKKETPMKMLALVKRPYHVFFSVEKNQKFFSKFRRFLVNIGYRKDEVNAGVYEFGRPLDPKTEEPDPSREDDIMTYVDSHKSFMNDDYEIDVVFGNKIVFIIISSREEIQEKLAKAINEFSSF